jgi:hypothetical protein
MASYHLSVKSGKRGKAENHAAYIAREGKYGKNNRQHDLIAKEHGNLPEWANDNPATFWEMADKHERANGAAYREFELALPRELSIEQNLELIRDFIKREIGNKPFQFAIHSPGAALGEGAQTHGHIMTSDRKPDGIERSAELHFKRHNSKYPEIGGCKKDSGGKDKVTLKNDLITRRENWAELQNTHLEKNGHTERVDHRSNKERGIANEAEKHLGYVGIKMMTLEEKNSYKEKRQGSQNPMK